MAKKYGKNVATLRGYLKCLSESNVGIENILLVKALINIPGRNDEVMSVPIDALGDTAIELQRHDGEWIEVEGRTEGREWEGKYYSSVKIFEIKTLPMHKDDSEKPPPDSTPNDDEKDVPF